MRSRPPLPILALLVTVACVAASGCLAKRVSRPPDPAPEKTYEQGILQNEETDAASESEGGGSAGSGGAEGSASSGSEGSGSTGSATPPPPGSAATAAEMRSGTERELDESLANFGEELRRERDRAVRDTMDAAAAGAAAAGSAGTGSSRNGTGEGSSGVEQGSPSRDTPSSSGKGETSRASAADPPDLPDGSDDDVVARQLREMAESETDPELRAIYWQEYLDYKSGQRTESRGAGEPEPAPESDDKKEEGKTETEKKDG